jgi:hypothetical protein
MSFDGMQEVLPAPDGHPGMGGYHRFGRTRLGSELREWFAGESSGHRLDQPG